MSKDAGAKRLHYVCGDGGESALDVDEILVGAGRAPNVLGLAPLLLETSPQALFLIPMAVSLGFGIVISGFMVLFVTPAVAVIIEDLRSLGSASEKTAEANPQQDRAFRKKPVIVDVEMAVAVMLTTSPVKNETMRDQFRIAVINALPADQIDWESINWVQLCPFRTVRP